MNTPNQQPLRAARRALADSRITVRSAEGEPTKIVGYAATWDAETYADGMTERVQRGAFARSLASNDAGDDTAALFNHDSSKPLGRKSAGTLLMEEDDIGLRYEITPPDTSYARDLMVSMERGDVKGSSFQIQFGPTSYGIERDASGGKVRVWRDVTLLDVSPVTFPAYHQSSSALRSRDGEDQFMNEQEIASRDAEYASEIAAINAKYSDVVERAASKKPIEGGADKEEGSAKEELAETPAEEDAEVEADKKAKSKREADEATATAAVVTEADNAKRFTDGVRYAADLRSLCATAKRSGVKNADDLEKQWLEKPADLATVREALWNELAKRSSETPITSTATTNQGQGAEEQLDALSRARATKDSISYAKAYSLTLRERPDLYAQYEKERKAVATR